jgi:hypothetical protein
MSRKFYGPNCPIKTKKEWNEVFEKQTAIVASTLGITMDQARVRQMALLASGIMDAGHPDDPITQRMIDMFLTNPSWDSQPKHFGEGLTK